MGGYADHRQAIGTDAVLANYDVELHDATLTVTAAKLVVTADKTKVYGAGNPQLTGSMTGIQNGDAVTAGFSAAADEKSGVGELRITAKALGTDAVLANYDVELARRDADGGQGRS